MERRLNRGDVWTVGGGGGYAGKPRPAVIVQDDVFLATSSVTVCLLTSNATESPLFRLPIEPTAGNGLRATSRLMVDKLVTVERSNVGKRLGRLTKADMALLDAAIVVFLGLASPRSRRQADS